MTGTNNEDHCCKHRVRFSSEVTKLDPQVDVLTQDAAFAIWYAPADFQHFKETACSIAQCISSRSSNDSNPASYKNVLSVAYAECVKGSRLDDEGLNKMTRWFANAIFCRRGIEVMSVKPIKLDQRERRRDSINRVLELQKHLCDEELTEIQKQEIIRKAYSEATQPSRLFAEAIARAAQLANDCPTSKHRYVKGTTRRRRKSLPFDNPVDNDRMFDLAPTTVCCSPLSPYSE